MTEPDKPGELSETDSQVLDPKSTPVRRNPSVSAHRRLIAQMKADQDQADADSDHRDEETEELSGVLEFSRIDSVLSRSVALSHGRHHAPSGS